LLTDFIREVSRADREKGRPASESGKNPPAQLVGGLVKEVDAQHGLVTISIGSNAGLVKGQTLEAFRLKPEAKYLGTIRILETTPHQAVAQPVGRMQAKIEVGDMVASRVLGR
jgi:hypothetical protein